MPACEEVQPAGDYQQEQRYESYQEFAEDARSGKQFHCRLLDHCNFTVFHKTLQGSPVVDLRLKDNKLAVTLCQVKIHINEAAFGVTVVRAKDISVAKGEESWGVPW